MAEHGAPAVAAMRRIKTALDPLNLLPRGPAIRGSAPSLTWSGTWFYVVWKGAATQPSFGSSLATDRPTGRSVVQHRGGIIDDPGQNA